MSINFKFIQTNGIQLHTALAGPEDGVPVILLHGFPEAWFGWHAQIEFLADSGFRVIVPDQRGYNLSTKPAGVASYSQAELRADILGLAEALGYDRFHLAGHDFGAIVAWNLARHHPDRIKQLAIANVPHPTVMRQYLRTNFSQLIKSWYAIFFQLPRLPERMVRANNWQFLIRAMPKYLTPEEQNRYRTAWEQPGAITGMINWYRAALRKSGSSSQSPRITVPTLIIWGQQDPHLSHQMASLSVELCDEGELVMFADASHWVLQDKPAETSQLLGDHFGV